MGVTVDDGASTTSGIIATSQSQNNNFWVESFYEKSVDILVLVYVDDCIILSRDTRSIDFYKLSEAWIREFCFCRWRLNRAVYWRRIWRIRWQKWFCNDSTIPNSAYPGCSSNRYEDDQFLTNPSHRTLTFQGWWGAAQETWLEVQDINRNAGIRTRHDQTWYFNGNTAMCLFQQLS